MAEQSNVEACQCGETRCDYIGIDPCWGKIKAIDEFEADGEQVWVHACTGHADMYEGGPYKPEPR